MSQDDPEYTEFDYNAPAGACEPDIFYYRIYPEEDFNQIFGRPPATVIIE